MMVEALVSVDNYVRFGLVIEQDLLECLVYVQLCEGFSSG